MSTRSSLALVLANLIGALVVGPAEPAFAQDTTGVVFRDASSARRIALAAITRQVGTWDERMADDGYRRVGPMLEGELERGQTLHSAVWVIAERSYRLISVCDDDCSDVDLVVRTTDGEPVFEAVGSQPPAAGFEAGTSGALKVEVTVVGCSNEPCLHATALYEKLPVAEPAPAPNETPGVAIDESGALAPDDQTLRGGEYYDIYEIEAEAGETLVIDLQSEAFNTWLVAQPPGGGDAINNDDHEGSPGHSRIEAQASESGSWTIWVTSNAPAETGDYRITVQRRASGSDASGGAGAGAAPTPRVERGRLETGDSQFESGEFRDTVTFQADPGSRVVVDLRSTEFDPYLILAHPEMESVANDDFEGSTERSVLDLTVPSSGTYTIWITSKTPGESGAYELRVTLYPGG